MQTAIGIDESHVVTAIQHFSIYMPIVRSLDCTASLGPKELTVCTIPCPSGYHPTEIRKAYSYECDAGTAVRVLSKCERNDGFEYTTCGTLGCDPGYHTSTIKKDDIPFCQYGTTCQVNAGPEFETCDWTCPPGYQRTGSATASLLPCGTW